MKVVNLNTASSKSVIYCGDGAFEALVPQIKYKDLFLVTDTNVAEIYGDLIEKYFPSCPKHVIKAGEASKTYSTLIAILKAMANANLTRSGCVIALGGGVVGDIAGLAASLYMRGVHLVQIPTTLLSQVDSSVGGKTAVDMGKIKNAIGTFYQPEQVIVDPVFLHTLPEREMRCGMGEIVKYAAINDGIFKKLSSCANVYDFGFLDEITYDCILHKAKVVEQDERDSGGVRKSLNVGHTAGHALELFYGDKSHGEYVAIGMNFELYIAEREGVTDKAYADELKKLILLVVPQIPRFKGIERAAKLASHDKKNTSADRVSIVAPTGGGAFKEIKLPIEQYIRYIKESNMSDIIHPLKLAVIGKDVSASKSPEMHGFIADQLGYKITYDKVSIPEDKFEDEIEGILQSYDGVNVTIPYKLSVISHLKKTDGDAVHFGSVNTVSCASRVGYNTDGLGFALMLRNNGVELAGKRALLLGAGGAGRSVAKKLKDMGADVYVYDKFAQNAKKVAEEFFVTAIEEVTNGNYEVIVNATGVGMHKTVGVSPVGAEILKDCNVAVDLIYAPQKSEFLRIAEGLGKKIINGEAMLFYQAYYSDCYYFGIESDAKQAKKLFELYSKKEH